MTRSAILAREALAEHRLGISVVLVLALLAVVARVTIALWIARMNGALAPTIAVSLAHIAIALCTDKALRAFTS